MTNRITSLIVVNKTLNEAVESLVGSLFVDGYTVVGELPNDVITERVIFQSVDRLLDYLAEKYKFVWYVDEFKSYTFY